MRKDVKESVIIIMSSWVVYSTRKDYNIDLAHFNYVYLEFVEYSEIHHISSAVKSISKILCPLFAIYTVFESMSSLNHKVHSKKKEVEQFRYNNVLKLSEHLCLLVYIFIVSFKFYFQLL